MAEKKSEKNEKQEDGEKPNLAENEVKEQSDKAESTTVEDEGCKKEPSLEEQILTLNAKCKELEGAYLRKAADFENYRKRMIKEKQEAVNYANSKLLTDLLVILDNFDRAVSTDIKNSEEKVDPKFLAFESGILMIKTHLEDMLKNDYGLEYYPAKGEVFDPNIHEAIAMNPSPEVKVATVGEEIQKGYKLKDKVLRNSKVMVLMPETEKKSESEDSKDKKEN